jgi:3-oxoacyl-[acyl-carrier protein] reductase
VAPTPTGLDGRVVLVTGAGRGVGRGICLALAAAGAAVVVAAHHRADGDEVVVTIEGRGGRAACVECDVTSPHDITTAVAAALALGGLDALVHNAISNRSNEPVDVEAAAPSLWEEHAAVSVRALLHLVRAAHRPLTERGGAMVVLQSPAGIQGSADRPLYAMVKGAQRGFVKSLAREWGPDGVRVNGVAPLAMSPALEAAFDRDPGMQQRLAAVIPLGWFGDPEHDIGPAVAFLCGPAARYITGQTLVVSGGRFTAL